MTSLAFAVTASIAWSAPKTPAAGPESTYGIGRRYDMDTVTTVSGTVASVESLQPMRGRCVGVHLILKTKHGDVDVHLGPRWYLDAQELDLQPGQSIAVEGSQVLIDGRQAIIASEVTHAGKVTLLRDPDGAPLWAGSRVKGSPCRG